MKRFFCWMLLLSLLCLTLPAGGLADHQFLLDSDSRRITAAELWDWDRESLSFMFNEIFARHGFTFDVGGKFYNWFNAQPWYQAVRKVSDQAAYTAATPLEWDNYHTIKSVITAMESSGWPYRKTAGSSLKSWTDFMPPDGSLKLTGFTYTAIRADQRLDVYSAPSAASWRGANGKAMVNTSGAVWAAGWENGWLLIFYELTSGVNAGGVRVGYVNGSKIQGKVGVSQSLSFSYARCPLTASCALTDDPLRQASAIATLRAGTAVTYLTTVTNQRGQVFDYIETTVGGQTVRGFIPSGCLNVPADALPDLSRYEK